MEIGKTYGIEWEKPSKERFTLDETQRKCEGKKSCTAGILTYYVWRDDCRKTTARDWLIMAPVLNSLLGYEWLLLCSTKFFSHKYLFSPKSFALLVWSLLCNVKSGLNGLVDRLQSQHTHEERNTTPPFRAKTTTKISFARKLKNQYLDLYNMTSLWP